MLSESLVIEVQHECLHVVVHRLEELDLDPCQPARMTVLLDQLYEIIYMTRLYLDCFEHIDYELLFVLRKLLLIMVLLAVCRDDSLDKGRLGNIRSGQHRFQSG